MTRAQVLDEYAVNESGRITSPGKFEAEMVYVPHFWEIGLSGFADTDDGETFGFSITAEDRAEFPELGKRRRTVRLREDSQGFVYEVR